MYEDRFLQVMHARNAADLKHWLVAFAAHHEFPVMCGFIAMDQPAAPTEFIPVDNLPSIAELQLLVPQISAANRGPQSAPAPAAASDLHQARDSLSHTVASRRAERTALWQDSSVFQDSFFAPDSRMDSAGNSEFAALQLHQAMPMRVRVADPTRRTGRGDSRLPEDDMDSIGGIVTDDEPRIAANSRH